MMSVYLYVCALDRYSYVLGLERIIIETYEHICNEGRN